MNWKPTEGQHRAHIIVQTLYEESAATGLELRDDIFRHHVIDVLAMALDRALSEPRGAMENGAADADEGYLDGLVAKAEEDAERAEKVSAALAAVEERIEKAVAKRKGTGRKRGRPRKAPEME